MKLCVTVLSLLVAGAALAQSAKTLSLVGLYHKPVAEVDKALGKPSSVGVGNSFREYATPSAGVYVKLTNGKSTGVTITFRKSFPTPEKALAAVGVSVKGKKPSKENIIQRDWSGIAGAKRVSALSTDGKVWETVEISD